MKYFVEANKICLVDINELIKKLVNVEGCSEQVLKSSDLFFANKVKAIPITDCKKCKEYVPYSQVKKNHGRCPTKHAEMATELKAKWEAYDYDIGCFRNAGLMCSNCHTEWGGSQYYGKKLLFKYCPTCGAKIVS